jgi:hypothetical protein
MNTTSNSVLSAEPIFGWWNATISQATEKLSQRGQAKLLVRLVINDATASGRVVYGHLSLSDFPRAKALVNSLKKALGLPESEPLPELGQIVGKAVRVRISPWATFDGHIRESVSDFAEVEREYTRNDKTVVVTPEVDDTPF